MIVGSCGGCGRPVDSTDSDADTEYDVPLCGTCAEAHRRLARRERRAEI